MLPHGLEVWAGFFLPAARGRPSAARQFRIKARREHRWVYQRRRNRGSLEVPTAADRLPLARTLALVLYCATHFRLRPV
jgi:hypothetical protein